MKELSMFSMIALGMVIVALLIIVMFDGHGRNWVPVLLALLVGGAVAKALDA
jgi:lipoprotein signal peptidase